MFTAPDAKALGRNWLIWQYSARGRLAGYSGRERFIDLNVFNGTREDFAGFLGKSPGAFDIGRSPSFP